MNLFIMIFKIGKLTDIELKDTIVTICNQPKSDEFISDKEELLEKQNYKLQKLLLFGYFLLIFIYFYLLIFTFLGTLWKVIYT